MATACDWEGTKIGYGGGSTLAEAMIRVYRCPPRPAPDDGSTYSDEPPF